MVVKYNQRWEQMDKLGGPPKCLTRTSRLG